MSRFTRSAAALTLSVGTLVSLPALAAEALNYNQISRAPRSARRWPATR